MSDLATLSEDTAPVVREDGVPPLPATTPDIVRATARLQFHKDFTLEHAERLVPYFASLGISHLYASPLLKARPGSTHGYDIVDHHTINPELGGEPALRALVAALRARGMGLILDIVPNHMGVGGADNGWWLDVLEWGRASVYASYFDIDWDPPDATLRNKLLAPFLGANYGEVLDSGDLALRFDDTTGKFVAGYFEHRFPIDPRTYATILRGHLDLGPFQRIGPGRESRHRAANAQQILLGQRPAVEAALAAHDPRAPAGRAALHALLERQNYRLAWWRAASDEINWRRFFDINSLAGVRQEEPRVFDDTHETIFRLYAKGMIDGVRIDHVDGLADPRGYCRKLRRRLQTLTAERPSALRAPAILWIEKILVGHERLDTAWLTDGTTGYDFMDQVSAVLHDPAGEGPLTHLWTTHANRPGDFADETRPARRQVVREQLFSELYATAAALHRVARRDRHTRDYTLTSVRRTVEELLVHFPVYRIYAGRGGISDTDQQVLNRAVAGARRTVRAADRAMLDLAAPWLAGAGLRDRNAVARAEQLRAMVRFQQLSAPAAAKSVEDTAFYRYGRLLSRNEVGSEPSEFALTVPAFHAANRDRARRFPRALLATATHDHKRGEDTRARLAVLSELPDAWEAALTRWTRLNAPLKRALDGIQAPDAADELMLYQTLVGAWPLDLSPDDAEGRAAFRDRVAAWQEKSVREAKRHTSWTVPDPDYEAACQDFLDGVLDPDRPARVVHEIAEFAARVAPAGALNGLSQTLLRLAAPGIPDLYQGSEWWDFSLVDPDNRRPVDFPARLAALDDATPPIDLIASWRDGRIKQAVIARALAFRTRAPALFASGAYTPLKFTGPAADHALAFARTHEDRTAIAVVSRLAAARLTADVPLLPASVWSSPAEGATFVNLPRFVTGTFRDVLTGLEYRAVGRQLPLAEVLARLPVALLEGS